MLDRNSQLAVPGESYFLPPLAQRHSGRVDVDAFVDDLSRLDTIREWGVDLGEVRRRLRPGMSLGEAISAVYDTYAAAAGKKRWGDKTPMYMQYLGLLERLFPTAIYVHLIRDGRDTAVSYLNLPPGVATEFWGHPTSAAGAAAQWAVEIQEARALGRRVGPERYCEVRYEQLVDSTEEVLEEVCSFAGLPWEPGMLGYPDNVDVSTEPHHQRLKRPPTKGLRDWRTELEPRQVADFEEVAGDVLADLGYELADRAKASGPGARSRARILTYRTQAWAWRTTASVVRRSPLWARRHPPLV
jgi:hypothetical protein